MMSSGGRHQGSVRNIGFLRESKLRQVQKERRDMELTFVAKDQPRA